MKTAPHKHQISILPCGERFLQSLFLLENADEYSSLERGLKNKMERGTTEEQRDDLM